MVPGIHCVGVCQLSPEPTEEPPEAASYHKVFAPAEDVKVVVPPTFIVDEPETKAVGADGVVPATDTATASEAEQPFPLVTVKV